MGEPEATRSTRESPALPSWDAPYWLQVRWRWRVGSQRLRLRLQGRAERWWARTLSHLAAREGAWSWALVCCCVLGAVGAGLSSYSQMRETDGHISQVRASVRVLGLLDEGRSGVAGGGPQTRPESSSALPGVLSAAGRGQPGPGSPPPGAGSPAETSPAEAGPVQAGPVQAGPVQAGPDTQTGDSGRGLSAQTGPPTEVYRLEYSYRDAAGVQHRFVDAGTSPPGPQVEISIDERSGKRSRDVYGVRVAATLALGVAGTVGILGYCLCSFGRRLRALIAARAALIAARAAMLEAVHERALEHAARLRESAALREELGDQPLDRVRFAELEMLWEGELVEDATCPLARLELWVSFTSWNPSRTPELAVLVGEAVRGACGEHPHRGVGAGVGEGAGDAPDPV